MIEKAEDIKSIYHDERISYKFHKLKNGYEIHFLMKLRSPIHKKRYYNKLIRKVAFYYG